MHGRMHGVTSAISAASSSRIRHALRCMGCEVVEFGMHEGDFCALGGYQGAVGEGGILEDYVACGATANYDASCTSLFFSDRL